MLRYRFFLLSVCSFLLLMACRHEPPVWDEQDRQDSATAELDTGQEPDSIFYKQFMMNGLQPGDQEKRLVMMLGKPDTISAGAEVGKEYHYKSTTIRLKKGVITGFDIRDSSFVFMFPDNIPLNTGDKADKLQYLFPSSYAMYRDSGERQMIIGLYGDPLLGDSLLIMTDEKGLIQRIVLR